MLGVFVGLFGLAAGTALAQVHIAECAGPDPRECCVDASCCSADAGDCGQDGTCSCSVSCGKKAAGCTCTCEPDTQDFAGGTLERAPAGLEDAVSLTLDGASLHEAAETLEQVTGWKVHVPLDALRSPLRGEWVGTLESVLDDFSRAQRLRVLLDTVSHSVTLVPRD
jgi:hypothetical protein